MRLFFGLEAYITCCVVLLLLVCACAPKGKGVTERPQEMSSFIIGDTTFVMVPQNQIPAITIFSKNSLIKAAKANQLFLKAQLSQEKSNNKALMERFFKTNQALLELLNQMNGEEDTATFDATIKKQFVFYAPKNTTESKDADKNTGNVLVTGYFQPELLASYVRTQKYTYPIYAVPSDLVQVSLQDFDNSLPAKTIYGRVVGNRLMPYYTRAEIEQGALPSDTPVLAWLASPLEGLLLHIQGSGILILPDGNRHFIHYAANNGHLYRSVGSYLVEQGILPMEQVSWQAIAAWAKLHPDQFLQASFINPRYIFFRFEEDGPIGVTGQRLEPMHSIALDRNIYGLGGLFLLHIEDFQDQQPLSSLVFHQDVGSAIKGHHRVDLYVGEGNEAGTTAGRLKNAGRLFLLLSNNSLND